MKVMLGKSQSKDKLCIVYNIPLEIIDGNEPLGTIESFKYLGLEGPSNYMWSKCTPVT